MNLKWIVGSLSIKKKIRISIFLIYSICVSSPAQANPEIDKITAGNVNMTSPSSNTLEVNQSTARAILEWHSFNINPNEKTHFQQPPGGIALNRIDPAQGVSQILGQLSATGKIILVNQAGIFFGPNAHVDVGGIIASTRDITDKNFLSDKYIFTKSSHYNGSIINYGTIKAEDYGLVSLLASNVINNGLIQARFGNVVLASGDKMTLDLYGDQLINFSIDKKISETGVDENNKNIKDGVRNTGEILADGGMILITAKAALNVVDNAINMQGILQAKSVHKKNGTIFLSGDQFNQTQVSGKMDASGYGSHQKGGDVFVSGKRIFVASSGNMDVSGDRGGGNIIIGGNKKHHKLPEADTTIIAPGSQFSANAITKGDAGKIKMLSDNLTAVYGDFNVQGGSLSGHGGEIETSGPNLDVNHIGIINAKARDIKDYGWWVIDPSNVTINNNATQNISFSSDTYTPTASGVANVVLNAGELGTRLNSANVMVVTANAVGLQNGDIIVNDAANQLQTNWGSTGTTLTLQADRNITISSNISLSGTNQGITLVAGNTVNSGGVTLNGTLNGGFALSITSGSSGAVTLGATIGATTPLNSVSITGPAGIGMNTATVSTTGAQTYNNAVTLGSTSSVTGGTLSFQGVSLGSNTLTVSTTASNSSIAGVVSGTGGLVKSGSGTLALTNGASTYTGSTTINAGTLSANVLADGGTNSSLGAATGAPATIGLGSSSAGVLLYTGGSASTNRAITIGGSGGGTIRATTDAATLTLAGNIDTGGNALTLDENTANITVSGVISGAGSLTKTGSGLLILSGVNTYSGDTTINVGTLQLGIANAISSSSDVSLADAASAIFNLNNFNDAIGSLAGGGSSGGNVSLGSGTLTTGGDDNSTSYSGVISGTGNLIKSGAGTMILGNAANTYTGSTTIHAGTLSVGTLANAGINSSLGAPTGSSAIISLGSSTAGILSYSGGSISTDRRITIGGAGGGTVRAVTNGATLTLAGNIDNSGNTITFDTNTANIIASGILSGSGSLNKISSGALTLSGNNTYGGGTTVSAGTLNATSHAAAFGTGSVSVTAGATLSIVNSIGSTITNNLTLNGVGVDGLGVLVNTGTNTLSGTVALGSATTIGVTSGSDALTLSGIVSGANSLTKSGSGSLTLSGINTYSSGTTISAGTLNATGNAAALGTGSVSVTTGATLGIVNSIGSTITNNLTLNGTGVGGNGALVNTGTNTLSGTVALGSATLIGVTSGSDALTLSGIVSGANSLTKSGSGSLTLSGINTYSSGTTVSAGTLNATGNAAALGTGSVSVTSGATLGVVNSIGSAIANNLTLNGTGVGGNGALVNTGTNTLSGTVALGSATSIGVTSGSDALTLSGIVSGANSLTKSGSGSLTLSGINTYSSGTTISAGTLNATGNAAALGTGSVSVTSGATLGIVNSIGSTITNNLTLNGTGVGGNGALVNTGTNTLSGTVALGSATTVGVTSGSDALTLSGIVSGANSLTKSGSGSLTLSGINTYSSGTTVSAGTLNATGNAAALGTGSVSVTSGATLGIVNSIGSTITNNLTLNGVGVSSNGALINTGINTLSGTVALGSATSIGVTSGSDALTLSGIMSGANNLTKSGAGSLILSGSNTYSGTTTISAGTLNISNISGLGNTSSTSVTSGATLDISFSNGSLGNTNAITLNGTGVSNNGALKISGTGNTLNNVLTLGSNSLLIGAANTSLNGSISGPHNLEISFNNSSIALPAISLTSNGNLTVEANGAITQSDTLSVQGTSSFNAGGHAITLDTPTNNLIGDVTLMNSGNNDITIINNHATQLATVNAGRNFSITSAGAITQTNALTASGTVNFTVNAANSDILLTHSGNSFGSGIGVTDNGNVRDLELRHISSNGYLSTLPANLRNLKLIFDNNNLTLPAITLTNNLIASTGGSITQSGPLVVNGDATITAGSTQDVTLTNSNNNLKTISVSNGNDVAITNSNSLILGTSTINGNLTVNANGAITQTGALSVNKIATFSSGSANDMTLTSSSNHFKELKISSAKNASIFNDGNLEIGLTTLANNFNITAQGAVSQTGSIHAQALTVTALNGIVLNSENAIQTFHATNDTGDISFFNNVDPPVISGITQNGNGNILITNVGELSITGLISTMGGRVELKTLSDNNLSATLTINSNITTRGGNIYINAANPANINPVLIVNGILDTTGGGIGQGVLTVGNAVALNVLTRLGAGNITLQGLEPPANNILPSLKNIINVTTTEAFAYLNNPLYLQNPFLYLTILNDPCVCKMQADSHTGLPVSKPYTVSTESDVLYKCS